MQSLTRYHIERFVETLAFCDYEPLISSTSRAVIARRLWAERKREPGIIKIRTIGPAGERVHHHIARPSIWLAPR